MNPYNFARQFPGVPTAEEPNRMVDITEVGLTLNGVSVDGLMDDGYQLELDYLKSFNYLGLQAAGTSNHITMNR